MTRTTCATTWCAMKLQSLTCFAKALGCSFSIATASAYFPGPNSNWKTDHHIEITPIHNHKDMIKLTQNKHRIMPRHTVPGSHPATANPSSQPSGVVPLSHMLLIPCTVCEGTPTMTSPSIHHPNHGEETPNQDQPRHCR